MLNQLLESEATTHPSSRRAPFRDQAFTSSHQVTSSLGTSFQALGIRIRPIRLLTATGLSRKLLQLGCGTDKFPLISSLADRRITLYFRREIESYISNDSPLPALGEN